MVGPKGAETCSREWRINTTCLTTGAMRNCRLLHFLLILHLWVLKTGLHPPRHKKPHEQHRVVSHEITQYKFYAFIQKQASPAAVWATNTAGVVRSVLVGVILFVVRMAVTGVWFIRYVDQSLCVSRVNYNVLETATTEKKVMTFSPYFLSKLYRF